MKPVVLISKTWCGNLAYDRVADGKITHALEFEGALLRSDVEAFRQDPDAFITDCVVPNDEDPVDALA